MSRTPLDLLILHNQKLYGMVHFTYHFKVVPKKENAMLGEGTITTEQKIDFLITGVKTAGGNPAEIDGSLTWTVQAGNGSVLVHEADTGNGFHVWFISGPTEGDTVYMVEGDADLGEGVVPIADIVTVHVTGAMAATFEGGFGTPVNK